ncbi:hypothetical protein N5079_05300 [Planotetraspora sp. A-T 1434]|uniref:hypothetical protein n=1 Tax=Planotetraspora sp. A-T 1434 TaxID=2979219 RepID=UPI0021BF61F9|nr:hypothetical protein [Planotetraspora sp. A-T 1434]MCT9929634.1 hypothetical protein [Planotetraspora sp. A-T 1434]
MTVKVGEAILELLVAELVDRARLAEQADPVGVWTPRATLASCAQSVAFRPALPA